MAPKQPEKIENPHVGSSSEEDEEESGSSESVSSGEDSKKDESSDDDGETLSKLTQKSVAPAASAKKPESDSEVSESESDSDPEPAEKKTKPLNSVGTKTKPDTSGSALALPESSTAKRSLKLTEDEASAAKKKTKTAATGEEVKKISGDEAKKMFQRLFSGTDETAMLQGFLDFTSTRGDPYEKMDAFCDYVKTLIDFNATKSQIVTKLQRCKKKFVNMVKNSLKKGRTEDKIRFAKELDQKAFDLSRKIWGVDGVFPAKPRKKSKDVKSPHASPSHAPRREEEMEIPKAIVVNTHLTSSSSREIASFFKGENSSVVSLDESMIAAGWDLIEDGPKKRAMEEKMKKLKAMQVELCLQRSGLVDSTARMVFKENASS
ncbi:unnamed protein product [Microthlaspi erraticum]|uniref:Glabrous enhancer-binding protein-like DBD domain-containing protein n=1 Tax=Microthlaspi erraticum TaxID=1685480 RepID=A0A6D2L5W0_9BRAS|nr:unnamed protein product [Microthlaspi erraticum]